MEYRKLDKYHYIIRIDKGDEVLSGLTEFCKWEDVKLGSLSGLGIASKIVLSRYDIDKKQFVEKTFEGSLEVNNLYANITKKKDYNVVNAHINFSDSNFNSYGGKLVECVVGVTFEIVITVISGNVNRKDDDFYDLSILDI